MMVSIDTCLHALNLVNEFIAIIAKQNDENEKWKIEFLNKTLQQHLKLDDVVAYQRNARNEDFIVHGDGASLSGFITLRPTTQTGI